MKNATEKQDQTEEIMLVQKVSDEALEVAAGAGDNRAGRRFSTARPWIFARDPKITDRPLLHRSHRYLR